MVDLTKVTCPASTATLLLIHPIPTIATDIPAPLIHTANRQLMHLWRPSNPLITEPPTVLSVMCLPYLSVNLLLIMVEAPFPGMDCPNILVDPTWIPTHIVQESLICHCPNIVTRDLMHLSIVGGMNSCFKAPILTFTNILRVQPMHMPC